MNTGHKDPRFSIDDPVFFSMQSVTSRQPATEGFVVVAVMPLDGSGNFQYRIRPVGTGPNRVVSELELRHRKVDRQFAEKV